MRVYPFPLVLFCLLCAAFRPAAALAADANPQAEETLTHLAETLGRGERLCGHDNADGLRTALERVDAMPFADAEKERLKEHFMRAYASARDSDAVPEEADSPGYCGGLRRAEVFALVALSCPACGEEEETP